MYNAFMAPLNINRTGRSAAKVKMIMEVKNLFARVWWRFGRGPVVTVKWPRGWVILDDDGLGGITSTESADPNDHYRPWLEANVGRQYWDWDWAVGGFSAISGSDTLRIKFRKRNSHFASMVILLWG
jgi:hypothetical protein